MSTLVTQITPTAPAIAGARPARELVPLWHIAERCWKRTAAAALASGAATSTEIEGALEQARALRDLNQPCDLLEELSSIQGHCGNDLGAAVLALADQVAMAVGARPYVMPFAARLATPAAFYEAYDRIYQLARILLCPVIYAEDSDSVGMASINPVATTLMAAEIRSNVFKRYGIRPFVTTVRLDYDTWSALNHKHFEP